MSDPFIPEVLIDGSSRPILVYEKGRSLFHFIAARDTRITVDTATSLNEYRPLLRKGEPYSPKRAASFWLNHSSREITARAERILRTIVRRK